jgi:small conductance mechanosensitive channel
MFTLTEEIIGSVIVVAFTFLLTQGIGLIISNLAKRAGAKPPVLHSLRDVIAIIWVFLAVGGVLSITGLASEFTTLTVSGIAGIAFSLALQSTLSNVIAGFLLFHDKAIRLGDEVETGGVRGTIVHIALRSTWLRTQNGDVAIIGNNNLSNGPMINYSAAGRLDHIAELQSPEAKEVASREGPPQEG